MGDVVIKDAAKEKTKKYIAVLKVFTFVVVCRSKCEQKVTGCKILYLNNRLHGQSSSKKSRLKRVHLLFDDDGNAADVNNEGSSVTQRVKSFLQTVKTDASDQTTSNELEFSGEAVEDCLESVCSVDERNLCDDVDISSAAVVNSAEPCSSSLAVDAVDSSSSCQDDDDEEIAATAAADVVNRCSEMNQETNDDSVCGSNPVVSTSSSVASIATSDDPELSKYWWQRYRLFSRFDRGIMIDRGL